MIAADRSTARRPSLLGLTWLDPAIHLDARKIDPRVKPAGDRPKVDELHGKTRSHRSKSNDPPWLRRVMTLSLLSKRCAATSMAPAGMPGAPRKALLCWRFPRLTARVRL